MIVPAERQNLPSPALAGLIGEGPIARVDVTQKVWKYIQKHGLQDGKNADYIPILTETPSDLFGVVIEVP